MIFVKDRCVKKVNTKINPDEFKRIITNVKDGVDKELAIINMRKKGGIDIDPGRTVCRICNGKRVVEKRKKLTGRVYREACECTRRVNEHNRGC